MEEIMSDILKNTPVRYGMVVDSRRCSGCHACVIACKAENNMPDGKSLNLVLTYDSDVVDEPVGTPLRTVCDMNMYNRTEANGLRLDYYTRACQHCEDAPCVKHCPTHATWQREDGIVTMDPDKCIGCDICMQDCPYGFGVMRVIIDKVDNSVGFDIGDQQALPNKINTVKKCTFCAHRLDKGEQPFCVTQCPSRARFFGDLNNSGSEVSQLIKSRIYTTLPVKTPGVTVNPSVYFLDPRWPSK